MEEISIIDLSPIWWHDAFHVAFWRHSFVTSQLRHYLTGHLIMTSLWKSLSTSAVSGLWRSGNYTHVNATVSVNNNPSASVFSDQCSRVYRPNNPVSWSLAILDYLFAIVQNSERSRDWIIRSNVCMAAWLHCVLIFQSPHLGGQIGHLDSGHFLSSNELWKIDFHLGL